MITTCSYILSSFSSYHFKKLDCSQAPKVFGKSYQELERRLESKSKMMNISYSFFSIAAGTHLAGGLLLSSKMM